MALKKDVTKKNAPSGEDSTAALGGDSAETQMALAAPNPSTGVSGEINEDDIRWPAMALAHKTSKVVENEEFRFCDIVYAGEVCVGDPTNGVEFCAIGVVKFYEENLAFEDKSTPKVWNAVAAVRADGLHTEWIANQRPPVSPVLKVLAFVKCPDHARGKPGVELDPLAYFPYEITEEQFPGNPRVVGNWGIAVMKLKGSAYTSIATPIITALSQPRFSKNPGCAVFRLKTVKKTHNSNTYAAGVTALSFAAPAEFGDYVRGIIAPPSPDDLIAAKPTGGETE